MLVVWYVSVKNVALGDAGVVTTIDSKLAEMIRALETMVVRKNITINIKG